MKYITLIFLIAVSILCCGFIYMQKDKNGNTVFSDQPLAAEAKIVTSPDVNSAPSISTVPEKTAVKQVVISSETATGTNDAEHKPYTLFSIISPKDKESIQNQPTLAINLQTAPSLQTGDMIQIYLDGTAWGNAATSTSFNFTTPTRGTHTISAKLFDRNKKILKQTPTITIYVHQASALFAPPASKAIIIKSSSSFP